MATYSYFATNNAGSIRPLFSAMTSEPTKFNDVGIGDRTTFQSNSNSIGATTGSTQIFCTTYLVVVVDLGSPQYVTNYRTTWLTNQGFNPGQTTGAGANLLVEYSNDTTTGQDGTWTTHAVYSHGVPAGLWFDDISAALGITARYWRFIDTTTAAGVSGLGITVNTQISDLRITATAPPVRPDPPRIRATSQLVSNVPQITVLINQ
jgi:hypothetical protein